MPPFKTFRFSGWSGGLYASSNVFDQPQGTVPRISNLLFAERGGLNTVDGSHVVVRPGPPPAPLGWVSSGPVTSVSPPAPVVVSSSVGFTFTGNSGLGGVPSLPMTLTMNLPAGIVAGDILVAFITVKGVAPGVGAAMTPITTPSGWTLYTHQTGVSFDVVNVLYHVVTGTEGATQTFTYPAPVSNFNGYQMNGAMIAVRGANTLSPVDTFSFRAGTSSGGSAATNSATTTFANDLLLILMQPVNDGVNNGGAGQIVPGNIPGTTVQINQQSPSGALTDTVAVWSTPFAGPGATGTFTSPSGWPAEQFDAFVLALGSGVPVAGQLMAFPITASGVITPTPIIQGMATKLTTPQGVYKDLNSKLWVADSQSGNTGAIIGYANPQNDGGNTAPDTLIQGPNNSLLSGPYDVCVGTSGKIYVANYGQMGTGQILIYAAGATGDVAPIAQIGGNNTGLAHPRAVAIDGAENVYVLDDTVNSIKVWHAGNTGNVAPDQTIVGALTQIINPLAIRVDPNSKVWITLGATNTPTVAALLQFNTTDNGNVGPTTRIDSTALQPQLGFAGPTGIAFDVSANIYVSVLGNKNVLVFPVNSSGSVSPSATISGFPNGPWGIGVTQ